MSGTGRIAARFAALASDNRAGLVTFLTAGDPDPETGQALLERLPDAGADLVELGMPFSDPMADGPAIQASSRRALAAGQTTARTLAMAAAFRRRHADTPLVLMGYYNPIYAYGVERFVADAAAAGVDGLIVVDLPPEENAELFVPAHAAGIDLVMLVAPTSGDARLPLILERAGGFLYYVSITGITGTASAAIGDVSRAVARLKERSTLPVAVGFGIKTVAQATAVAAVADAAVVGSALVNGVAAHLDNGGRARPGLIDSVVGMVSELAAGIGAARKTAAAG